MDAISGDLIASWRRMPTQWHRGLTAEEIGAAEKRFDFEFPPDLRKLLQIQMPAGDGYPDWRDPETVVTQFEWPWEGIRYDIEYGEFWLIAWGIPARRAGGCAVDRAASLQ